ncbi:protease propeptide/inhibitor [Lactarius indigo]|nr:protease propeptide/inhibitor [Lactarius indigo]
MSGKYIVVFKKSATQEVIDEQADQVDANGGVVDKKFSSSILKGFSAEIPNTYLLTLQSNLTADDNEIDYIEPDSTVTTQT